jgi:hypothetical protein
MNESETSFICATFHKSNQRQVFKTTSVDEMDFQVKRWRKYTKYKMASQNET